MTSVFVCSDFGRAFGPAVGLFSRWMVLVRSPRTAQVQSVQCSHVDQFNGILSRQGLRV